MGSILNLVFDKWDSDGNPIANLSEINEQIGGEYIIDLDLLLNLPNPLIKINKCNLSDIHLGDNYY